MTGVVLLSDEPVVEVRNNPQIYMPMHLNVTVGSTVIWNFDAAGNSVTESVSIEQFSSSEQAVRCAVAPNGFDSGVNQDSNVVYSQTFNTVGEIGYFSTPFCPFPQTFPQFFGTLNVCNPITRRPTDTPTPDPTETPTPTPGPCPDPDPCAKPKGKRTVINFYFADILEGARCQNCSESS
jgi:plastocyanin